MKSFIHAVAIGLAVALSFVTTVFAAGVNINATATGLAMWGYDPVSYFDGAPTPGSYKIVAVHNDATYRFANEENKAKFVENPDAYAPAYGGYCAYGAALGSKFDGDPTVWKIVDNVLYLNLAPEVQKLWEKDLEANLSQANENWEKIEFLAPADTLN